MQNQKKFFICGIDEAGRGPLAGPVSVGGVILAVGTKIQGINDSKKLKANHREELEEEIKTKALAYSCIEVEPDTIDQINILQATKLGMKQVAEDLIQKINAIFPDSQNIFHFLVDGNQKFCTTLSQDPIIKGDGLIKLIGSASILAKVSRDRIMKNLGREFPQYGFESHMGYPTKHHKQMIIEHGVLTIHRKTFAGVKEHLGHNP
jgi:ribonuclease HII